MTVEEFASWAAFDNIRPIGGDRVDFLLAQIHTTLRATAGIRNCSPFDSAYWLDDRDPEKAEEEKAKSLRDDFEIFVKAHNERIEKNGNDSLT
jgi:hypothetical protein